MAPILITLDGPRLIVDVSDRIPLIEVITVRTVAGEVSFRLLGIESGMVAHMDKRAGIPDAGVLPYPEPEPDSQKCEDTACTCNRGTARTKSRA
jgi:hypothetical protein